MEGDYFDFEMDSGRRWTGGTLHFSEKQKLRAEEVASVIVPIPEGATRLKIILDARPAISSVTWEFPSQPTTED